MEKQRVVYMDNIKIFLTCLVVAHHAAQAYGPTGGVWVVDDPSKVQALGSFFFINASYMMGLYFFISGYFMVFSIKRKTNIQFALDRLKRLGIPLAIFTFLVFLPFNYLGSDKQESIVSFFIHTYFNKPPIATGHLWFVASLLLYSFVYLALFNIKGKDTNESGIKPFYNWYIPVYLLLLTFIAALVRMYYPVDVWRTWVIPVEVAHIPQYLSLFLIGTLFNKNGWLSKIRFSTGMYYFALAITVFVVSKNIPATLENNVFVESFTESCLCIGISLGLLAIFQRFINNKSAFSQLLSDNTYGIYLVHLLIVIVFQNLFLSYSIGGFGKFILVTILSIAASLLVSYLLRKIKIVRSVI